MVIVIALILSLVVTRSHSQSIQGFGSAGGSGPKGGIGDTDHPVLEAHSFATDALIPLKPNTTRQLSRCDPPVLSTRGTNITNTCPPPRRIEIDTLNGARQEMLGFGFAWTDSSVSNFNRLKPELLHQVMEDLFSEHPRGNNMGMMRHTIGSSDLSGHQYSFDDNGPTFNQGQPDLSLENFRLTDHGEAMAEMIATMGSYKSDVFLFGAPWSYPGWMKHNGLFVAPNLNSGDLSYNVLNNSFDIQYIPQAVQYFIKYIDSYAERGIIVNGLSLMNEPLNYKGSYPCMFLDASDAAAILNGGLGNALKARNIAVMAYDHNTDQPIYPSHVMQRASGLVSAAAWHCYAQSANYSVLEDFNHAYPETPQFMTECAVYLPKTLTIDWQVVNAFIPAIQHGASGATSWVLATDPDHGPHSPWGPGSCAGCEGAIIVNSSTHYMKTNAYYMVGQFSRFIRRGARNYRLTKGNVGNHLTPNQFNTIAVQNPDKSWAVVMVNNLNRTENVRISFTGSDTVWEGVVENSTLTTWLLPAEERIAGVKTTPVYPFMNDTQPGLSPNGNSTNSTCALPPVTTIAASSSATTSTTPLTPVPDTTHIVERNVLGGGSGRNQCENDS